MEETTSPSQPRGPVLVIVASVISALVIGAAVGVVVTKKLNSSGTPIVNAPEVPVDAGQAPTTPSVPAVDTPPLAAKENLEVEWTATPIDIDDNAITQAAGLEYGVITAQGSDYAIAFKKVGVVKGGARDGQIVVIASIPSIDGPGGPNAARLIIDPKVHKILVLTQYQYSKDYLKDAGAKPDGIDSGLPAMPIYQYMQDAPGIVLQGMDMPHQVGIKGSGYLLTEPAYATITNFTLTTSIEALPLATTVDGQTIYEGKDHSCLYLLRADHSYALYDLTMPFMQDARIPKIVWNDGKANTADYNFADVGGCGARECYAVRAAALVKPKERLVRAGTTSNNEPVYALKNANDPEFKTFYEEGKNYYNGDKQGVYSQAEVLASHPIFYWQDPMGRWIRFTNSKFGPMVECGKPVVYLYPEKNTDVRVSVGLKGEMTKSEPEHGKTGWSVVAQPNGYVINKADGKTYPNLFWEGMGVDYKTPTQGFVVKGTETDAWLTKTLATIGFTERESAEFREFWVPRMPKTPYVFVTFVPQAYFDRDAPLRITPRPDHVFRVFMEYRGLDAPTSVEPLTLPKITRDGFTVVEWGGALRK